MRDSAVIILFGPLTKASTYGVAGPVRISSAVQFVPQHHLS
jgi:hypothetical protein